MERLFRKQNLLVIAVAILTIIASSATSYFVVSKFNLAGGQSGYRHISFADAISECQSKTRKEFGNNLSQLVVDRHSSRYENDAYLYKIFLNAYTKKNQHEKDMHYVSCYVKPSNGRVSVYDANMDTKKKPSGVIRKGSDKFIEWPQ